MAAPSNAEGGTPRQADTIRSASSAPTPAATAATPYRNSLNAAAGRATAAKTELTSPAGTGPRRRISSTGTTSTAVVTR